MKVIHTIQEFRQYRRSLPAAVPTPFVPTMGALHDGHASLVCFAKTQFLKDSTKGPPAILASIFVNPAQFGPGEDFSRYPRTLEADVAILESAGCDALLVPTVEEMYPGIQKLSTESMAECTSIDPGPLAQALEGAIRPGHFRGVCTVVAKLLNIAEPTHLLLGQKDYQQQAVLRRMCADLLMPVEVVTCPTIREADGLAMSSRNRYLSPEQRIRAVGLFEALMAAKYLVDGGERAAAPLEAAMEQRLLARGLAPQYAVVADSHTLQRSSELAGGLIPENAILLIAAKLGATRLIDNMFL